MASCTLNDEKNVSFWVNPAWFQLLVLCWQQQPLQGRLPHRGSWLRPPRHKSSLRLLFWRTPVLFSVELATLSIAEKFFFTLQAFYAKFVNQSVDELSSESARRWMNYFRVSKSMLILVNITIHNRWGTFAPTTTPLCTKAWTTNMEKLHFAFEFTLGDAHLTRGDLRWLRRPREDKDTRHLLFRCQLTVDKGFPLHLDWPMMELISFFPCMNMIYNELWRFPTSVAFCAYKVCHSRPQTPDN